MLFFLMQHILVLALWYSVPTTLYFDGIVWWLSNCKYKSVCVGFLHTDVWRLPFLFYVHVNEQKLYLVLYKQKPPSWRVASSSLKKMLFFRILYVPGVLDGASDVLSSCCSLHSCQFFILSSGVLNRMPSHMCGRLYLSMLLLIVRLFTLIILDSLVVLARFFSSLPTMLKFPSVVMWPGVDWKPCTGESALRCSLSLSPNCSNWHLYALFIAIQSLELIPICYFPFLYFILLLRCY